MRTAPGALPGVVFLATTQPPPHHHESETMNKQQSYDYGREWFQSGRTYDELAEHKQGRSLDKTAALRGFADAINNREAERLFAGVFPGGISYADRWTEEHSDYKRLAFLDFQTLTLDIKKGCPPELRERITEDAAAIQARKGEQFRISTCGQTITLGWGLEEVKEQA